MRMPRKEYYDKHKDAVLRQQRKYRREHREQIALRNKRRYERKKHEILNHQREYRRENPVKRRAAYAARYLPLKTKCEICGSTENLEHHHPDYTKPLEVITLCRTCHNRLHSLIPSSQGASRVLSSAAVSNLQTDMRWKYG